MSKMYKELSINRKQTQLSKNLNRCLTKEGNDGKKAFEKMLNIVSPGNHKLKQERHTY